MNRSVTVSIHGPKGSGKTILVHALSGFLRKMGIAEVNVLDQGYAQFKKQRAPFGEDPKGDEALIRSIHPMSVTFTTHRTGEDNPNHEIQNRETLRSHVFSNATYDPVRGQWVVVLRVNGVFTLATAPTKDGLSTVINRWEERLTESEVISQLSTDHRVSAPKTFPWKCSACGYTSMYPATIGYSGNHRHSNGHNYFVEIESLEVVQCRRCLHVVQGSMAESAIAAELEKITSLDPFKEPQDSLRILERTSGPRKRG